MKIETDVLKQWMANPKYFGVIGAKIENDRFETHIVSADEKSQYHFSYQLKEPAKEPMTILMDKGAFDKIMTKFDRHIKSTVLDLKVEDSVLTIEDGLGNEVKYVMPNKDECNFLLPEEMPKIDEDGITLMPLEEKDGQIIRKPAPTIVIGGIEDFQTAFVDMQITDSDFFTFQFKPGHNISQSGRWDDKKMTSKSTITVKTTGKPIDFTGTTLMMDILKAINGTTELHIGKIVNGITVARIFDRKNSNFERNWVITSAIRD